MWRLLMSGQVALLLVAGGSVEARAQWCAYYDAYTYTCGFKTFRQCLDTISGIGGECRRDPHARSAPAPGRERGSDQRSRDRR